MISFNLVGNNFTHTTDGNLGYATARKRSKYIQWVFDGSGEATVYVDHAIPQALTDNRSGPKYAWLLESNPMSPPVLGNFLNDDSNYLDVFDIVFTHRRELLERSTKFRFAPGSCTWVHDIAVRPKTKLVSMISSSKNLCAGHSQRLEWVDRLRSSVDLFGRGFHPISEKEEGLNDYMFSVAIENDTIPSYFSEKLLDCFATGTVPIYLGTKDIGEFFNAEGIIALDDTFVIEDLSEDLYHSMLPAVQENCELVKQYDEEEDYLWHTVLEQIWGR